MLRLDCLPPVLAARTRGARAPQLTRRLAPVLAQVLVVTVLACGKDAESPTGPESVALEATQTLAGASAPLSLRMVSAGSVHSCGLTAANEAYCWGAGGSGQLGDGTTTNRPRPAPVAGGLRFIQVSAGGNHTCGVTAANLAYCWGENLKGKLGDGTITQRAMPVAVLGAHRFRTVRAGGRHTCGVTLDNVAYCWGSNTEGQVGDSSDAGGRRRPVRVAGGLSFRHVDPGASHTCGVTTNDKAYCWGYGGVGQIGDGKTVSERHWPRAVAGGLSFRLVSVGGAHSCGLTREDRAYCWGANIDGRLGDGTNTGRLKPVAVAGGRRFNRLSAGQVHTCALNSADRAYCWGNNTAGQLGDGATINRSVPVLVSGGLQIASLSAGGISELGHTCGVTVANSGYCWGSNLIGQLGDGTTTDRSTPVPVIGPS